MINKEDKVELFFHSKTFIVTGASSGIGEAVSKMLRKNEANVVEMDRDKSKNSPGHNLEIIQGDVTNEDDIKKTVDAAISKFGKLHGVIHCAGIGMRGLAIETSVDVYRKLMDVNFFSMIYFYKNSIELLRESKGHLVAVSSMMGRYATQGRSGYVASKHALQGYIDSVRLENEEYDVHTMVVTPGFVKTNVTVNALTATGEKYNIKDDAHKNGLMPEDVAKEILNGIKKRKRDIYPSGRKEKLGLWLSKNMPKTLDKMLLKTEIK